MQSFGTLNLGMIVYLAPFGTVSPTASELFGAVLCQTDQNKTVSSIKPLKTCSHRALRWEGAKNSGFSRLHLTLYGVL